MNYELAKELKEAGFPIRTDPASVLREPMTVGREKVFTPTLSELIEACGERFAGVVKYPESNEWHALYKNIEDGFVAGSTPEEAVAKLWLALNKK